MATLTITIPDAQVPRVLEAFAARAGLPAEDMTANDAREVILGLVKTIVRHHERDVAEQAIVVTDVDVT